MWSQCDVPANPPRLTYRDLPLATCCPPPHWPQATPESLPGQRRTPCRRGAEAGASSGLPPGPAFVPAAVPSRVTWEAGSGTARVTRTLEFYPSYYRSGTRPRQGKRAECCKPGSSFLTSNPGKGQGSVIDLPSPGPGFRSEFRPIRGRALLPGIA